jgi:hypothetical protein
MISLYYFTLTCSEWLSILLLFTSTATVLSISSPINYDLDIIYNMPVITRSQSKAASVTEVLSTATSINSQDSLLVGSTTTSTISSSHTITEQIDNIQPDVLGIDLKVCSYQEFFPVALVLRASTVVVCW